MILGDEPRSFDTPLLQAASLSLTRQERECLLHEHRIF